MDWGIPQCEKGIGKVILKPDSPDVIAGVQVQAYPLWPDDRGYFLEIMRFGQGLPAGFDAATTQVSAALSYPDTIKEIYGEFDADDSCPELTDIQTKATIRWFEMICAFGREATIRAKFDRSTLELVFETAITPAAPSKLADAIATIQSGSSLFAKMLGDRGAFNYSSNLTMDAEEAKKFGEIVASSGGKAPLEE